MLGAFNVNGASCELLIDQDALVWWPRVANNSGSSSGNNLAGVKSNGLPSPIKHLRRLSKSGSSNDVDKSAPDSLCDDGRVEELQKRLRRVDFNQIIGVTRVSIKRRGRPKKKASDRNQANYSDEASTTTKQNVDSEIREAGGARPAPLSVKHYAKLKIYYAKRNEKKSTGRLLKLKKITLGLLDHHHHHHHHHHHSTAAHQSDEFQTSPISSTSSTSPPESPNERNQPGPSALDSLHDLIEQHLELKRRQRPRRLLVFVNPYGGKGRAMHLYKSRVRKIFDLAQVECQLIVTKYANHARNTIEDPMFNLECFDGIICIGGDGMFAELMNGLLFRFNRDKLLTNELNLMNKRLNDELSITNRSSELEADHQTQKTDTRPEADLEEETRSTKKQRLESQLKYLRSSLGGIGEQFQSPNIPIGVIGAGSTDANLFGFIGTNDTVSATLNIVLGSQIQIDVCSIHSIQEDRLLRFVSTFVAYGYFGDVIRESEKFRWLGPSRYDLTALNSLIKYRYYNGLVRILRSRRDGTPLDLDRCHLNCSLCKQAGNSIHDNGSSSNNNNNNDHLSSSFEFDKTILVAGGTKEERAASGHLQVGGLRQEGVDDEFEILEEEGSFVGVNAAVTACRCPQTRKGFSPGNHLANGCADLILVRPCSRIQYINYLIRTGYTNKSAFDLRYVDAYRCRQFEFIVQGQQQRQHSDDRKNDTHATDDFATSDYQSKGSTKLSTNDTSIASSRHSSNANSLDSKHYYIHQAAIADLQSEGQPPPVDRRHASTKAAAYAIDGDMESTDHDLADELGSSSWNADGEILREQSIRVKVNNKLLRVFGTGEPQPRATRCRKQQSS